MTTRDNQSYGAGMSSDTDYRLGRLHALMFALRGHEFTAEIHDSTLQVSPPGRPGRVLEVRCEHRAMDAGRLWYVAGERGLAEADNITWALTAVKELTAPTDADLAAPAADEMLSAFGEDS